MYLCHEKKARRGFEGIEVFEMQVRSLNNIDKHSLSKGVVDSHILQYIMSCNQGRATYDAFKSISKSFYSKNHNNKKTGPRPAILALP